MAAIHETAYPRLKPKLSSQELEENFSPTKNDLNLLNKHTRSSHSKLGFMLSLKCFQCLGYHISINIVPKSIIEYISKAIDVKVSKDDLSKYMNSKQRKRHKVLICRYLKINTSKKQRKLIMKSISLKSASIKENLSDIINDILEELIKGSFEIPAFSTLIRLARASRSIVTSELYQKINNQLTDETKTFFDDLFLYKHTKKFDSKWAYLKQEVKKPTSNNIKDFIEYIEQLREWKNKSPIDLSDIPEHRLDQYITEATALDISDMRKVKHSKRYALSAMLLYKQYAKSIDSIVIVLIRWLRKIKNDALSSLEAIKSANEKNTDRLISDYKNLLVAFKKKVKTNSKKLKLLEQNLPDDIDDSINACDQHLIYANNNILPLMLDSYLKKRTIMFRLIRQIEIKSSTNDLLIEKLLKYISDGLSKHYSDKISVVNKYRFELSVFIYIIDEISCADAFITNSYEHDDPNKQLVSWDYFHKNLESYTDMINKPKDPDNFISNLQDEHYTSADNANKNFVTNEHLNIVNGEPILKRVVSKQISQRQELFSKNVASKMPLTDIISVFNDVENWLNISKYLKPLSGYESKIKDYNLRFVATCFAYGCNVGPVQAERSLKLYSRKQIAWLFNHHITERRLNRINEEIIKVYKNFDLPYVWGNGKSSSVDGSYWDMYTNNLLAEHHIRYGKYGGIGYYHVSDQYVALFSNFIPCGVYEAVYIFDGIYEGSEELAPESIHGDTHAQNEVVFGFAYLLAITLMPRIRSFKYLNFYRPTTSESFNHIDEIFTSKEPKWDLIKSMYYDMLRVVMSIQTGKIKASTILKKICYKSRRNKLHQAFRELGRVVRTIFLLNYISDIDLRKKIQAATCRSEEFNDFVDWVSFGSDKIIKENKKVSQQKIITFSQTVANMVMFHTVANMTNAINQLSQNGFEYDNNDLSILSAYYRENINRFGVFELSNKQELKPLKFSIKN